MSYHLRNIILFGLSVIPLLGYSTDVTGYEYWFDNDFSTHKKISLSYPEVSDHIDIRNVETGLHFLNIRVFNSENEVSNLYRYPFFSSDEVVKSEGLIRGEYWFDDDCQNRTEISKPDNLQNFSVDLKNVDDGLHVFNYRVVNDAGQYSEPYRYIFYLAENKNNENHKIVGYQYLFNSHSTYVSIPPCLQFEMKETVIPLPNAKEVAIIGEDSSFNFSNGTATLSQDADISFFLRFKNESDDWSIPETYAYKDHYSISKPIVPLEMQKSLKLDKVSSGDFNAVGFEVKQTGIYYFRTSQDCELLIFNEFGKQITRLEAANIRNAFPVSLVAGKYYGVMINTALNDLNSADKVEIRLMTSYNYIPAPEIEYANEVVSIYCDMEDADIYYTLDGSIPDDSSNLYTAPFTLSNNAIIKAIAQIKDYAESDISSLLVDSYTVEKPSIKIEGLYAYLSCGTSQAKIYYTTDGSDPSVEGVLYVDPILMTPNITIKAIAKRDGYNDSEVISYNPECKSCEIPTIEFDGHSIELMCETPGADIWYTTDGKNPIAGISMLYSGKVLLDEICVVKAIAVKSDMNDSPMLTFSMPCYYDGYRVHVRSAGSLQKAFEWCGGYPLSQSLEVSGLLNDYDYDVIRSFGSLRHLNLENVVSYEIPEGAFKDMNLISITFPTIKFTIGNSVLAGCKDLASISWNSPTIIPIDILGGLELPNLLIYVKSTSVANAKFGNIIVGGIADEIKLTDSKTSNFFCDKDFVAKKISYKHTYSQLTDIDCCGGWETISLPFDVASISHSYQGSMAPFAANDFDKKPFWLCRLTESGFASAESILANHPYIIAMPNNERYSDEYILAGDVVFSASNVVVKNSRELVSDRKGDNEFLANYLKAERDECMTLNVGEEYNGFLPGSVFAHDYRTAYPFESVIINPTFKTQPRKIFKIAEETSSIEGLDYSSDPEYRMKGDILQIFNLHPGDAVDIFDVDGIHIKTIVSGADMVEMTTPRKDILIMHISRRGRLINSFKLIM